MAAVTAPARYQLQFSRSRPAVRPNEHDTHLNRWTFGGWPSQRLMNQVLERRYDRVPQATGVRRLILLFLLSSVAAGIWSTLTVSNGWAAVRSTLGQPPNARVASDWRAPQCDGSLATADSTPLRRCSLAIPQSSQVSTSGRRARSRHFLSLTASLGLSRRSRFTWIRGAKLSISSLPCIQTGAGNLAPASRSVLAGRPAPAVGTQSRFREFAPSPDGRTGSRFSPRAAPCTSATPMRAAATGEDHAAPRYIHCHHRGTVGGDRSHFGSRLL